MIFGHKKLSESVVMKEFEKVAIAKNMVKVSESSITKEASASYQPSNNLIDDMLTLAKGLRSRGFEKDASSLEEKVLSYKLAETHLYRAIDEDAEDMLEFAHPKKNKIQFEAQNGDGEVEDTLSQHKKIIDIVNKQPKKVAFEVLAETADILGLKKKADLDEPGKKIELIKYYKNQLFKFIQEKNAYFMAHYQNSAFAREGDDNVLSIGIDDYEYVLIEGYSKTWDFPNEKDHIFESKFLDYFCNSNNIVDEKLNDLKNGNINFKELISPEDVSHANNNLKNLYKTFYDKVNDITILSTASTFSDMNSAINIVKSLFDQNSWFIIKGLTNNDGLIENKIRSCATSLIKNVEDLIKLTNKSDTVKNINDEFNSNMANIIAGRFESIANKDSDPTYFKQVASIIRSFATKPYTELYPALVAFDSDLDKAIDFHKLDLIGQQWQKHYKIANSNNEIVKNAKIVPEDIESVTRPVTHQKAVNPTKYTGSTKSNFSQTYPEEFRAVADMQIALGTLADNLDKLHLNLTPDQIKSYKNVLLGTGYGEKGEFADRVDGEWGPKTQKALDAANQLFKVLNMNEVTSAAQRINGKSNIDQKEIAKLALENEAKINQVLSDKAGLEIKDKNKSEKLDPNSSYLDSLPENVNLLQTDPKTEGNKTVGPVVNVEDLSSFTKFLQFIRRDSLVGANTISGFNYSTWEFVLRWFYNRANFQAMSMKDPIKVKYRILTQKLLEKLPIDFADKEKIISPSELDGNTSVGQVSKPTGPTQNVNYKTNNVDIDGTEVNSNNVNKPEAPPFGYKINLEDLYNNKKYRNYMGNYDIYSKYLSVFNLDVNTFSYSPSRILQVYIKALNPEDILYLNGISNPSTLIPGQTTTKYTYLDLMNSNIPAAISMRNRAGDYALLSVVNGLSRDLPEVLTAYVRTSPSEKYTDIIMNAWDKWAANLSSTRSRINNDFAQNGQTPKVIF